MTMVRLHKQDVFPSSELDQNYILIHMTLLGLSKSIGPMDTDKFFLGLND